MALSNIKNALWFCYNLLQFNEHHEEKELKQWGAFWKMECLHLLGFVFLKCLTIFYVLQWTL